MFPGKLPLMREFFSLFSLYWENRGYRRRLAKLERAQLERFSWYRSLMRALARAYRWRNPFLLSRSARKKIELPASDLVYGETPPLTAFELLSKLAVDQADHIVECGGGTSVFSLVAVSAFGCRATVLEIVPNFVKKTREVASYLGLERVSVRQSDILADPIPEGTVYYLTGTTFSDDSWKKLQRQMAQVPEGAKAISLSVPLDSKAWKIEEKLQLPFSWGENTVYIQSRI
jgi:hypothetical protein